MIISLKNHKGALAEGKCIAINPLRTEMLAVGANDPYVRLYDRRMIKLATDHVIFSSFFFSRFISIKILLFKSIYPSISSLFSSPDYFSECARPRCNY